ncbi:MAG TPA: hypothetical protein PKD51_17600 [Saprospiraceae bacterium]|nr:hypothetical protein [Saprospiraceae bacterium]HMU04087.1 hypothetical protein [Saprospiraceae bacterium]
MHKLFYFIPIILFPSLSFTHSQINIDSVSAYIGQTITVCDKVAGTYVTKGDKPVTYLNLGANFPNSKLTIVIFQKDLTNFPFIPSDHYKGKNVCVTGKVKKYKEKIEVIVSSSDVIVISNLT